MSNDAIDYFKIAILQYNKGDVVALLNSDVEEAGPLLCVTVNGIDIMGGLCYGFDKSVVGNAAGSAARSTQFMVEHMNMNEDVAKLLYSCIRCGLAHQGMPKIGFKFFNTRKRVLPGGILFKGAEDYLYLDVTELAYSYIDAIEKIAQEPEKHIKYLPTLDEKDKNLFTTAKSIVRDDISVLLSAIQGKELEEEEAKLASGKIESISSLSAYTPDEKLNINMAIPPT